MVLNLHSDHQNTEGLTPSITAEEILLQQERILESPEFNATEAQVAFLKFVINKFISGESHEIKGYTVATQVFGRTEDFDQNTDPIVSIHANKLRRALERYYLTAGVHDPLRIDIPKGAYIPTFTVPGTARKDIPVSATPRPDFSVEHSMPSIMIRPFKCLTDTSEAGHISIGLATELAIELSRYQDFRVILQDSAGYGKRVSDNGIRFMIDGTLAMTGPASGCRFT